MSNIPVADAHCDFLYYMTQDGWDINRPTRNQAVALPYIKQGGGKLLFALSISAPTARMDDAAYENARKLVLKYAELISQEIQSVEFRF